MESTRYFREQIVKKRPYLTIGLCASVVARPLRRMVQADGRVCHWGAVRLPGEDKERILRVITLDDGSTVHNAFIDRNFRKQDR